LATVLAVPGIIKQLGQLAVQVPGYIEQIPDYWNGIQDELVRRFNVDRETLTKAVPIDRFAQEATAALPDLLGNAVTVVQRVAAGIANTLLVLILSLYIMLDGKRLSAQFYRIVPIRYQDEFQFVFSTIDRTFGGFLRGQVLMALIQGIFTGLVMRLFGLQFTMITSILSGVLMFIPELGAPIAMLAPSVASALQGSDATIPLFIIMLVFQQILLRFVIPQIMSEAIGMPPLLILVSVLVSAKVMGLWGFFFGIPVAGALYTIAVVALEQMKQSTDARDRQRQSEEQTRQESDLYE
jgi:predicted PurR-regulated permease PerM